jgi:hypothetical protein
MGERRGYRTPEEAATADYPAVAQVRVVEVRRLGRWGGLTGAIAASVEAGVREVTEGELSGAGEWVEVVIDTVPSHPGKVKCFEEAGLWYPWGNVF